MPRASQMNFGTIPLSHIVGTIARPIERALGVPPPQPTSPAIPAGGSGSPQIPSLPSPTGSVTGDFFNRMLNPDQWQKREMAQQMFAAVQPLQEDLMSALEGDNPDFTRATQRMFDIYATAATYDVVDNPAVRSYLISIANGVDGKRAEVMGLVKQGMLARTPGGGFEPTVGPQDIFGQMKGEQLGPTGAPMASAPTESVSPNQQWQFAAPPPPPEGTLPSSTDYTAALMQTTLSGKQVSPKAVEMGTLLNALETAKDKKQQQQIVRGMLPGLLQSGNLEPEVEMGKDGNLTLKLKQPRQKTPKTVKFADGRVGTMDEAGNVELLQHPANQPRKPTPRTPQEGRLTDVQKRRLSVIEKELAQFQKAFDAETNPQTAARIRALKEEHERILSGGPSRREFLQQLKTH